MDINKDIAEPNDNMRRSDDGKYIYRSNSDDFDIDRFNLFYEQYREKRKKIMRRKMEEKLERLNAPKKIVPIYQKSVGNILIATKDALFEMLDDMLQGDFSKNVFMKDDRLFHLGLFFVIIVLFMYLYTILIGEAHETEYCSENFRIKHIHKFFNDPGVSGKLVLAEI